MNKRNFPKYITYGILLIILGLFSHTALCEINTLKNFQQTAIMENGRIKPLQTFAQNILKQFSGASKFNKQSAVKWLSRVLFDPESSYNDRIFLITNLEVINSINIPRQGKARNRYSFSQLKSGLEKLRQLAMQASKIPSNQRGLIENEILSLHNKIYVYQQLLATFDFSHPHPDFTISHSKNFELLTLDKKKTKFSFLEISQKKKMIDEHLAKISNSSSEELNDFQKELMDLSQKLSRWANFYKNLPVTILPSITKIDEVKEQWQNPWAIVSTTFIHNADYPKEIILLDKMVKNFKSGNDKEFEDLSHQFNQLIIQQKPTIRSSALNWEVIYNSIDPFYKSKFFYGFAALFLLLSFIILTKWLYRFSFFLLGVGFLINLFGILVRMYIRQRPPVTNLYETFVFTGLIAVILGFILEFAKKKNIGILTGALAGFAMLMIAGKYSMDGDTMGMLVAVLDSNFWLATHVITIMLGYSGILLSGFLGHVYLLQKIFKPESENRESLLKSTYQAIYSIQAFGIIFTFLGTVLGGIWADQSWGRFWGWDPKENGALVILLWSAILFHAKLSKWIKETGMAIGAVIGVIAVALAWFGVNLLGVGLHSYGFTSGIARSLFMFIGVEVLFLILTSAILLSKKPQKLE